MENEVKKFTIYGHVQGVGFRFFAQRQANIYGILGYVKNHFDGSVEVLAIGMNENLRQFKNALKKGPMRSDVTKIQEEDSLIDNIYNNFYIL